MVASHPFMQMSAVEASVPDAQQRPLLTVITVVKNALPALKKTYASLEAQERQDFSWLIVDGASDDGTVEWLRSGPRRDLRFVSGKDKSIYDAMNKAIALMETEYCFFLNAGDTLCDTRVLGRILDGLRAERPELAYGKFILEANPGFPRRERGHRLENTLAVFYGKIPCHQATIVSKRLFEAIGTYDDRFRIYADREWLLRLIKRGKRDRLLFLDFPIVNYDPNGFSYQRFFAYRWEYFSMLARHANPVQFLAGALGWLKAAAYVVLSKRAAAKRTAAA